MTPAPRVDQLITQLAPLTGPQLAVLIPSPFGNSVDRFEVGPNFATGLDDPDPSMRAATARAMGLSHDPTAARPNESPARLDVFAGNQVAQPSGRSAVARSALTF